MNKIILIAIMSFFLKGAFAQDTMYIKTSAVCETCKKIIEKDLSFEKGVKSSSLDVETKTLMVVYNPEKTTPEKVRIAVTKAGYDADSLKADPKAFKKLPECCQDPNHKE
jgi:mercuric ion binding protein